MIFPEYKKLDLSNIAQDILSYWDKYDIFKKSVSNAEGKTPYVFYEGPPSANGLPGIHHVLSRKMHLGKQNNYSSVKSTEIHHPLYNW